MLCALPSAASWRLLQRLREAGLLLCSLFSDLCYHIQRSIISWFRWCPFVGQFLAVGVLRGSVKSYVTHHMVIPPEISENDSFPQPLQVEREVVVCISHEEGWALSICLRANCVFFFFLQIWAFISLPNVLNLFSANIFFPQFVICLFDFAYGLVCFSFFWWHLF